MNLVIIGCVAQLFEVPVYSQELRIDALETSGQIVFQELTNARSYRVEWSPNMGTTWSRFEDASDELDHIRASGSGSVTAAVPMVFRVVAELIPASSPPPTGKVLITAGANSGNDPDFGSYSLSVGSFWIDRYETSKTLWDEIANWASTNSYDFNITNGEARAIDHPVHHVSWHECVKWCNARSEYEGRSPVYYTTSAMSEVYREEIVAEPYVMANANGYRLPTVEEWKYAARGGVTGRRFPWGDTIDHDRANYRAFSALSYDTSGYAEQTYHPDYNYGLAPYTSRVGSFAPNGYGLYDMCGNLFEWCFDQGTYPGSRIFIGGGWAHQAVSCRIGADGSNAAPAAQSSSIGFRTVRPPAD
jgi:formylglycine-generating enzyme required for sulfatase activity